MVVAVMALYVSELVVFATVDHVVPPSVDSSQRITKPVLPAKVSVPVAGEQSVALELTVPPTEAGFTIIASVSITAEQGAEVTV